MYVPEHGGQAISSAFLSLQSSPPLAGFGLSQVRVLVLMPPQVTGHLLQSVHELQAPFTAVIYKI